MRNAHCRSAITLFDTLVLVVIVAVVALTVIPQFVSSTSDPKSRSLEFNLHTVRSQIGRYKVHHLGKVPTLANFGDQMTKPTNVDGATTGANLVYGPYFQGQVPRNAFNGSNQVVAVATPGQEPTGVVAGNAGWQYDQTNGGFFPNNAEFYAAK